MEIELPKDGEYWMKRFCHKGAHRIGWSFGVSSVPVKVDHSKRNSYGTTEQIECGCLIQVDKNGNKLSDKKTINDSKPIEVTHLHDAETREINGDIGYFNIIINMNYHRLTELYVLEIGHIRYPDYMKLQGEVIITKRGVLIENIHPYWLANGRVILTDIDDKILCHPNIAY